MIAALGSACIVGFAGFLIELFVIRRLGARGDLSTILATWGISLCLSEGIRIVFGAEGKYVDPPLNRVVNLGIAEIPSYHLFLIAVAVCSFLMLSLLLRSRRLGLALRSAIESPVVATIHGVDAARLRSNMFIFAAAYTGLAGALIAPVSAVNPYMGTQFTVDSFLVVIVGGMDSLWAAVAGAGVIGGLKSIFDTLLGATPSKLLILALVLLIVILRPNGILTHSSRSGSN